MTIAFGAGPVAADRPPMIVCSCNIITRRDIECVIERILCRRSLCGAHAQPHLPPARPARPLLRLLPACLAHPGGACHRGARCRPPAARCPRPRTRRKRASPASREGRAQRPSHISNQAVWNHSKKAWPPVGTALKSAGRANRRGSHEGRRQGHRPLEPGAETGARRRQPGTWVHYRLTENWGFTKFAKKERAESIEEMHHADKLIDRIIFLEGHPNLQTVAPLRVGQNIREVLDGDLAGEIDARTNYKEVARYLQRRPRLRHHAALRGAPDRRGRPYRFPGNADRSAQFHRRAALHAAQRRLGRRRRKPIEPAAP